MKRILLLLLAIAAVSASFMPSGVTAATEGGKFSLSPHIGGYIFHNQQNINSDPVYGIGIGYGLTKNISLEGSYDFIGTSTKGALHSNVDVNIYRFDALFHFNLAEDVKPYFAASVGFINTDIKETPNGSVKVVERDNTDVLASYGLGLKWFIRDSFLARAEFRHLANTDDSKVNLMYSIGVSYLFGGKPKPIPDSDGDGVNDMLDKCPGTPAGAPVNADGCPLDSDGDTVSDYLDKCPATPAGTSVDANGCPLDSDGDGVSDYLDKCPATPAGAPVNVEGCPLDSDGDGVSDYLDKCPATPAGAPVNADGCPLDSDGDTVSDYLDKCPATPAGTSVDANGCPLDSDGDGILDPLDKCPGTPPGAPVDANGCPLDSDGDGIIDLLDKCPGTLAGIQVDASGCPLPLKEKVSIELNVEFEFNSAVVRSIFGEHLTKISTFLSTYPDANAVIEGHTDSAGTDTYNLKLSQQRAENVVKYLVEHGIAAERLKAVGFGESKPIADNSTEDGRQRNRRVVAVISTIAFK
ncbi:MAG: OmpA family protein [Nitrospirae bacterium]|nr:OmpA family protein [Nitrospirota bacterium]